jgi:hypothetical protein
LVLPASIARSMFRPSSNRKHIAGMDDMPRAILQGED